MFNFADCENKCLGWPWRFPLQESINSSRSSLHTPGECYIYGWWRSTSIRLYSHPIVCCFQFMLLQVQWTSCKCPSIVILSVAAFAASRWAMWCLRYSSVSVGGVLEGEPIVLLNSVPRSPCCGVCKAMICCSGLEEMMITKRRGKSWARRYRKEEGGPEKHVLSFQSNWNA